MHNPQTQFRNLLSPITPEAFIQNYLGQKPLYIPGNRDKFSGMFDWADLNQIINLGHI